jgi:hypothetical protein
MKELQDEVDKHASWLPEHLKSTPQTFMQAVKQGFKTGFDRNGETFSFLDHVVIALIDLLDTVSDNVRHEKITSLKASLNSIKRTYTAEELDADDIESEIESMEDLLIDQEITLRVLKRERFTYLYHKNENETKKRKFDADIEYQQQKMEELRKKLETIKVSYFLVIVMHFYFLFFYSLFLIFYF